MLPGSPQCKSETGSRTDDKGIAQQPPRTSKSASPDYHALYLLSFSAHPSIKAHFQKRTIKLPFENELRQKERAVTMNNCTFFRNNVIGVELARRTDHGSEGSISDDADEFDGSMTDSPSPEQAAVGIRVFSIIHE